MSFLYWLPAAATAILIAALSHRADLPDVPGGLEIPDWLAHFLEYGFFTLTLVYGATTGFEPGRRSAGRVAAAVAFASFYGITDEYHQSFVPGRQPAVGDWVADTVGAAVMGLLVVLVWRRMAASARRV